MDERKINHDAYRRLKAELAKKYHRGRFVAISNGEIVADSAEIESLRSNLLELGKDPSKVLVVEAGIDYPEKAIIL
ncbi:MAG: hypothetical protein L0Y72_03075 [Gemmataceae bacterium]|nr:hypothetical protein [Gemmataceae bacterium]